MCVAVVLAACVLSSVHAAETFYCDEYPNLVDCTCRDAQEVVPISEWFNMGCTGEASMIMQQRAVLKVVKPECVDYFEVREYQDVFVNFCIQCPAPDLVGEWQTRMCIGEKTLAQREIIAYYFDASVDECKKGNWLLLELRDGGPCASGSGEVVIPQSGELPPVEESLTQEELDAFNSSSAIVISAGAIVVILAIAIVAAWWYFRE